MGATIRDVAKKAGVSLGTVSRYLNGHKLRDENRIKVEKAIKQLGFKENIIAKGLKNNRSMTIGVVIGSLTDIFSTSIVTFIEREVEKENYSIIVCDYEGQGDKLAQKLAFLKDRLVDGLILFPGRKYSSAINILNEYVKSQIPLIVINDDIPELEVDKVMVDNANAAFRGVERLIHLKHKEIAIINGSKDSYTSIERFRGYKEALRLYNIPLKDDLVKWGDFSNAGGYMAARELMEREHRPTALFITNYYMTLGAMMAINELNIRVPQELSVIGFDHFELADVIKPPLTVIEQPTQMMGELAARLVLRRIRGEYSGYPERHMVNTRLLVRGSDTALVR